MEIFVLPAVVKIIAKVTLERVMEHVVDLIDREQFGGLMCRTHQHSMDHFEILCGV